MRGHDRVFVAFLTKCTSTNEWKPAEGNNLKSLIAGICLGKGLIRSVLVGNARGERLSSTTNVCLM